MLLSEDPMWKIFSHQCDDGIRKDLAKTSQTPGKTQLINHFLVNETWYLTDLPGYGYAKVSKTLRKSFEN
jgi:GTP-binding protein EngB required for normal cell division